MRAGDTEKTDAVENASCARAGKKHPGFSFPPALQSHVSTCHAVTQLTEEPEKGACGFSPAVSRSKAGEGPGMDLRTDRPWPAHASIFKLHLLEYYSIFRSKLI